MRDCGKDAHGLEQLQGLLQDSWESPVRSPVRPGQEAWNVGAGSGCSRDRQARWDAQEMRTATTKVRREVYEEFQRLCEERGKTPYAVLRVLLLAWMRQAQVKDQEAAEVQDKPFTGWHTSGNR